MAVVNNTASEIGDVLTIFSQVACSADTISLTGYSDVVNFETGTRLFARSFRYSIDGVNYSAWNALTIPNLAAITGRVEGLLFFEFRYERVGSDPTGILEFININITGSVTVHVCSSTASLDTIFEDLVCNNAITAEICSNLLEKIYKNGIVPQYILRESEEGYSNDYVAFWSAICCYFSMFIAFMDEFDAIFQTKDYLREYLKQKGIYFCEKITFGELQYISQRFLDEIRKRGTTFVIRNKDFILQDATPVEIDGEWLRILCQNEWDEFLVEIAEFQQRPWVLDRNSLLYSGTLRSMQLNKTKENTMSFQSLANYDLVNPPNISILTDPIGDVMNIRGVKLTGIGFNPTLPPIGLLPSQTIKVEPEMDYEITFRVRRNAINFGRLLFGVFGFNQHDVFKPNAFLQIDTLTPTILFVFDTTFKVCRVEDEWYYIRGIIYAKKSLPITTPAKTLNVGVGLNMMFNEAEDIRKICPYILFTTPSGAIDYDLFDYKVRPLIKGKNILNLNDATEKGVKNPQFIQSTRTIYSYMKNNSETLTDLQVNNLIEKYLIPYENKLVAVNLTKQQI